MTTLYRTVLIESVEQAEALPIGTVSSTATLPIFMKVSEEWWVGVHGPDSDDDEKFENCDAMGITALVPIEAEEETSVVVNTSGSRDIDSHPYSEANMDSDGNVWFGEGHRRVDETEQFNEWAKQHTRTRFVTPWEEVSDKP